ncbi:hypothetical protein MMC32_004502 [Xylographa parallela]|nr:hypothetical protein [Xylographa parallela]
MVFDDRHTLASQLSDDHIAPQDDCPLFRDIPPEIRHLIFSLALTAYDGLSYAKGSFYDRPGYHYSHRIDTALLRTCKAVYLECSLLPVELNEVVAWCGADRGPPECERRKEGTYWPATVEQMAVARCHIFVQQLWLENDWVYRRLPIHPRVIHITIRHTDWWDWEHERALHLDPKQGWQAKKPFRAANESFLDQSWGDAFYHLRDLRQFVLELETVEAKRAELDEIIARAAGWRFPLGDGNVLVLDKSRTAHSTWRGLDRFDWNPEYNVGWNDVLEPYQTPKLKPAIVEMAQDFLTAQEASLANEPDSSGTGKADRLTPVSPQTTEPSNPGQALPASDQASKVPGSKAMTSEIAHKIITEVQNIQGFQPEWLFRIYGYIQTDRTEKEIEYQALREMEDMNALQYCVVTLTWVAHHAALERAATA